MIARRWRFLIALFLVWAGASCAADWQMLDHESMPAFALPDLNGQQFTLKQFEPKVVLVNFWAGWCEPCRAEMPGLNRLQQDFQSSGLRVIGINLGEGRASIQQFLAQVPTQFLILRDADSSVSKAWQARVLPVSFLVDRGGRLRYRLVGETDWQQSSVRVPIQQLLAE